MTTPDDARAAGTAPPGDNGDERTGDQHRGEEGHGGGRHGRQAESPPRSRTGAVWVGICVTVLLLGLLIVFIAQNTETVDVSFLWLDGTVPLAVALLVAAAGAGLLATIVGTIRIAQLRRLNRRG